MQLSLLRLQAAPLASRSSAPGIHHQHALAERHAGPASQSVVAEVVTGALHRQRTPAGHLPPCSCQLRRLHWGGCVCPSQADRCRCQLVTRQAEGGGDGACSQARAGTWSGGQWRRSAGQCRRAGVAVQAAAGQGSPPWARFPQLATAQNILRARQRQAQGSRRVPKACGCGLCWATNWRCGGLTLGRPRLGAATTRDLTAQRLHRLVSKADVKPRPLLRLPCRENGAQDRVDVCGIEGCPNVAPKRSRLGNLLAGATAAKAPCIHRPAPACSSQILNGYPCCYKGACRVFWSLCINMASISSMPAALRCASCPARTAAAGPASLQAGRASWYTAFSWLAGAWQSWQSDKEKCFPASQLRAQQHQHPPPHQHPTTAPSTQHPPFLRDSRCWKR